MTKIYWVASWELEYNTQAVWTTLEVLFVIFGA